MFNSYFIKRFLTLIIFSYAFFFFGNSFICLTDPDEVFYSLTAKEMAAKNEWATPYIFNQPQFEKPIFTYWLLRVAFDSFGQSPWSARFFPALFALFGVLGVYALGLIGFLNERKAFYAALILCSSALFAGMGKTVFTDMIFSVFILYSLLSFYLAYTNPKRYIFGIFLFFIFAALATLTKGPLGLAIPCLTVCLFLMYKKELRFMNSVWVPLGLLVFILMAFPWYVLMYQKYGQNFVQEFFYNDHIRRLLEAEHKGNDRWYFYPLTMVMGMFPWSIFVGGAFVVLFKKLKWGVSSFEYFILSWILIVFGVFQCAHSKLASYILPLFPALALLTGNFLEECLNSTDLKFMRNAIKTLAIFLVLLGIGVVAAHGVYKKYLPSLVPVYFLSAVLIALAGYLIVLLLKRKLSQAVITMSLTLFPFLCTAFLIKNDIEPYVSSFEAAQYVPHFPGTKTTILASKPYARGVRFYTGQDIVVLNINGGNYFSPHPIPILTKTEELIDFLKTQKVTFAILKKGGYKEITTNLNQDQFKVQLIKISGYNYVLRIESKI